MPELPSEDAGLFRSDDVPALDFRENALLREPDVVVSEISHASPIRGRVNGLMAHPVGNGRYPALLVGRWGEGNRTEFLCEAMLYGRAGAISLLVAWPWVGPASDRQMVQGRSGDDSDRRLYIQVVVGLWRGLDLLVSPTQVDARRIAYVGHSYGARLGAILTALDRRVRAAVLMAGTPDTRCSFPGSDEPDFVMLRQALVPGLLDKYLDSLAHFDAVRHVPFCAPAPLLFQFARFDRYFDAASGPREVRWYNAGHELNDPHALVDRNDRLVRQVPEMSSLARFLPGGAGQTAGIRESGAGPAGIEFRRRNRQNSFESLTSERINHNGFESGRVLGTRQS
jgi:pimeloyl-ACP methyl ester carboxylesterase